MLHVVALAYKYADEEGLASPLTPLILSHLHHILLERILGAGLVRSFSYIFKNSMDIYEVIEN